MADNNGFTDEFRERVRKAVSEVAEEVQKMYAELPTRSISYVTDRGKISQTDVHRKPNILNVSKPTAVKETAHWMYHSDAVNNNDFTFSYEGDDEEDIIEMYSDILLELAFTVFQYSGGIFVDEEAFSKGLSGTFSQRFGRKRESYSIVPIRNLELVEERCVLNPETELTNRDWQNNLENLEISKLSEIDKVSLQSVPGYENDRYHSSPADYGIKIETKGVGPGEIVGEILEMVVSALRLYDPFQSPLNLGRIYSFKQGPIFDEYGTYDWYMTNNAFETKYHTSTYKLTSNGIEEFVSFWDSYKNFLYTGSHSNLTKSTSKALSRFNYMYDRQKAEDQILDCVLALESSLLKDINSGYSIRIPLRATLLLHDEENYSTEDIYEHFEKLYTVRNQIIHGDSSWEEINLDDIPNNHKSFVVKSRYLLGKIVIRYFEHLKSGKNITQTNAEYLEPLLPELVKNAKDILDKSSLGT